MAEDFLQLFHHETDVVTLRAGEELFKKGDTGRHMYVIKSGEVQVIVGNHVFETVSAGGLIGEMALISDDPRSATVRATVESTLVPIDQKRFAFLTQQTPFFALRVMRLMSDRLRKMNNRATSISE